MKIFRFSRETIFLFAILALALFLRLWGYGFGLPYLYHADEPIVVNHALAYGTGDLNPHFFKIPPLVSYLLFMCYGLYFTIGRGVGLFHFVRDFENLFYFDPSSFYLIARLVFGVCLGTLTVYLLYRTVKRFWGGQAALWTSFFLAVNFLHVRDSHYIYADIPLVWVLLAGMAVILKTEPEGSQPRMTNIPWGHLFIGGLIGLATAVKYNGAFLAIPYLWMCLRNISWKKWPLCWFFAGIGAWVTFGVLNPFAVLDHTFFLMEITAQSTANSGGFSWLHHLTYSLAGGMGWPMLILALLGTSRALFGKDRRSQTLAVFVVGYYAVLCRFGQPFDRYVLPLIPFMLILASEILLRLKARSRLIFWVVLPFVVLPSILKVVHWDRLMSQPDARTVAKEWVETHLPGKSRIALDGEFFMPRLAFIPEQLEKKRILAAEGPQSKAKIRRLDALLTNLHQPAYELYFLNGNSEGSGFLFSEPRTPYDLETLKKKDVQYVFLVEALHPEGDLFGVELRANADRIMTFSPYRNAVDLTLHDGLTLTGGPFLWRDILPRERNGYAISIYKIRS